jgi:hypothetical protein
MQAYLFTELLRAIISKCKYFSPFSQGRVLSNGENLVSAFTETDDTSNDLDTIFSNSAISLFNSMRRYISTSDDEQAK